MNIDIVSKDGDFLPLAARMGQDGHVVDVFIEHDSAKKMYNGMIGKADSPLELNIEGSDLIIFDMVGGGSSADALKDKNYHVVGGGILNDILELDRMAGINFMVDHDIPTPPTRVFWDFEEAREFVRKEPDRYVFKPNGNLDTDLTYVSSSVDDLLAMFPYLEERCPKDVSFVLQKYVEGIEMSTEAWFNGTRFLLPLNSTMEQKPLMVGDVGPNTGCMGNVVWWWPQDVSQLLYERLFQKMEEALRADNYMGPLDLNAIWTPAGPFGLEFTARFGYDAIQALSRIIDGDFAEFLRALPTASAVPATDRYSAAVRISIPPYPHEGEVPNVPVRGITEDNEENIYLSDVMQGPYGLQCAGSDGYVCTVCADSRRLSSALQRIYSIIEKDLQVPNMQYRTDIGEDVSHNKPQVEKWIHFT